MTTNISPVSPAVPYSTISANQGAVFVDSRDGKAYQILQGGIVSGLEDGSQNTPPADTVPVFVPSTAVLSISYTS